MRSRYKLQYGVSEAIVAYHGRVYVDPSTGRVLRLTMDVDPPPDFPIQQTTSVIDYDFRDIGGSQYLLPVHADVRTVERAPMAHPAERPLRYHNVIDFRDYHKYATESKLGFDPR